MKGAVRPQLEDDRTVKKASINTLAKTAPTAASSAEHTSQHVTFVSIDADKLILEEGKFELSHAEYSILREKIADMNGLTPRKIRIIYYRYLLLKRLLTSISFDSLNILEAKSQDLIIRLLLLLSQYRELDLSVDEICGSIRSKKTDFIAEHLLKVETIEQSDLQQLLQCICLVCAY